MDKDANIFETASKELKKKSATPKKTKNPSKNSPKSHSDPELAEMLSQLHFMKSDLKSKFEEICRKSGLTIEQIENWIQTPKNLSPAEAAKLKSEREALADEVWQTLGPHLRPKAKTSVTTMRNNPDNERKAKTLGARKRWLPVP
jgi:uncharacterized protein YdcH (DUF465 family)